MEPSELLVNAAVAEGITSIATVHDSFYVCHRARNGSAGPLGEWFVRSTRSMTCLQEVLDWARRDLKEPKGLPDKRREARWTLSRFSTRSTRSPDTDT